MTSSAAPKRTHVYVDGFNLYFGALRGTPYKWLDLAALCQRALPRTYQVEMLRYFTAIVTARPSDLQQPVRQQTYIRALETLPNLAVHYGQFLTSHVRMPLVTPSPGSPKTAEVIKTEAKGSDVNLASHLLVDACSGAFDVAAVITDNSDLAEPIRLVRYHFGLHVTVLSPRGRSQELKRVANRFHQLRVADLAASQFLPKLHDSHGTFTKPPTW